MDVYSCLWWRRPWGGGICGVGAMHSVHIRALLQLETADWISPYLHCTLGEVIKFWMMEIKQFHKLCLLITNDIANNGDFLGMTPFEIYCSGLRASNQLTFSIVFFFSAKTHHDSAKGQDSKLTRIQINLEEESSIWWPIYKSNICQLSRWSQD